MPPPTAIPLQSRSARAALITLVEATISHVFTPELGDYANTKELDILVPLTTLLQHRSKHRGLATARAAAAYVLYSAGLHYHFIGEHYGLSAEGISRHVRRFAIRLKKEVLLSLRVHAALNAVTTALITPLATGQLAV